MSSQHRATPEQWADQRRWAQDDADSSCLLELRARVEALEAAANNRQPGEAAARAEPGPAALSLVDRVFDAICDASGRSEGARAAIRAVATWLRENPGPNSAWSAVARDLRDEANR